ncbi:MAG: HAMP domain-containing sensor histidine kinase [bacterium]|nr:HAMP domain-containing sensor histidine kinase [bacterium]
MSKLYQPWDKFLSPQFDDNYRQVHRRLTLIFSLAILILIFIYTGLVTVSHNMGKQRFQDGINAQLPPPPQIPDNTTSIINKNFRTFEENTKKNLWAFNLLVWLSGSILGYFLTGYLLAPAQEKTREQAEFISNASHELKTPVATIKAELSLLKQEKNKQTIKDSLKVISDENNNLQNLINNLLAFNSSNNQTLNEFNLNELVNGLATKFQKNWHSKKLQFVVTCPANLIILNNQNKISEILNLLLDNAGKYATTNTKVEIIVKQEKKYYQIQICNTGIGISENEQEKIFNRFYRITDRQVQAQTGSGLGLSIAKKLTAEINGELILVSGLPEKTIFQLRIPTPQVSHS